MDIDKCRKGYLVFAEFLDSLRIFPRILVGLYCYLLYKTIDWYMDLTPAIIDGCVSAKMLDCIAQAPTTQQAALLTAVVGIAAAIFAFYSNSGRKWNGFVSWKGDKKSDVKKDTKNDKPDDTKNDDFHEEG